MGITLQDIAKRARVSVASVSIALNNKQGVGAAKRQAILKIARELGYEFEPPRAEQATRRGTIRFIKIIKSGHVLNRDHDIFISDYINGIEQEAPHHGYNLEIRSFQQAAIDHVVDTIDNSELKGAIILGTELDHRDLQPFEALRIPVVALDTYYDFLQLDFVDMNNIDAMYNIVSHLYQQGHRDIGLVTSTIITRNFQLRRDGLTTALEHFGLPFRQERVFAVDSTFQGAYTDMAALLAQGVSLPPALFISNDIMAYGCIKAIKEAGLAVPADVSVIGFDDLPTSAVMEPPLTTYAVSKIRMGEIAFRILEERIESRPDMPSMKVSISGRLVIRGSVRRAPSA